ncbi:hypothetical protein [Desulfurobacterium sp.]
MRAAILTAVLLLAGSSTAYAGNYLLSAHGNTTYGVSRTSMPGYSVGNCDNCHEMHASQNGAEPAPVNGAPSPFALFAPNFNTAKTTNPYVLSDDYCFYCHSTTTDGSLQNGGIDNHNFSYTFGGYNASNVTGIFQMFNQASYHNLYDIYQFATGNAGSTTLPFSSFFKPQSNPCDACHNPHIVRANRRHVDNPYYTPLSKPSDHSHLWGDDANETLAALTDMYQPPYYYGSTVTFEPDGTAGTPAQQAAKMPDYISFCTDCHNTTNIIYSTTIQHFDPNTGTVTTGGNLYKIDWFSANGDKHGFRVADSNTTLADPNTASLQAPYNDTSLPVNANGAGFVLSCMDCHEAHGSKNLYLIREEVNGKELVDGLASTLGYNTTISSPNDIWKLCVNCHQVYGGSISQTWYVIHHVNPDAPYKNPRRCIGCHGTFGWTGEDCQYCHFHGGDDSILLTINPSYYTGRRTF